MHTFQIILVAILLLAAAGVVVCLANTDPEDLAPVPKTLSSLFVGLVAVLLTLQVILDHPAIAPAFVTVTPMTAPGAARTAIALPPSEVTAPAEIAAPAATVQPAQVAAVAAPAPAAQAAASGGGHDALLGGMAGFMLGNALGNAGGGGSRSVVHEVNHYSPPPSPSPAARTWSPPPSAPSARPVASAPSVASSPSPRTFRNTFTFSRRR